MDVSEEVGAPVGDATLSSAICASSFVFAACELALNNSIFFMVVVSCSSAVADELPVLNMCCTYSTATDTIITANSTAVQLGLSIIGLKTTVRSAHAVFGPSFFALELYTIDSVHRKFETMKVPTRPPYTRP